MQEPLTNLRVEKLTTSNEAMARCLQLAVSFSTRRLVSGSCIPEEA